LEADRDRYSDFGHLHITNTHFDEPAAIEIVCRSEIIITVHGCAETEPLVYVGGRDLESSGWIQAMLHEVFAASLLTPSVIAPAIHRHSELIGGQFQ
jgi:phage replication-related protein YjqB (UPF0714/DUF867 family)